MRVRLTRGLRGIGLGKMLPHARTLRWQFRWYLGDPLYKVPSEVKLIFSAHHLVLQKKAWVAAIEHVGDLCPVMYDIKHLTVYKGFIEKVLRSKYCKRIMPYLNTGKATLLANLNCGGFQDKIEVVHLGVRPKQFIRNYDKMKVTLLFLGTANVSNIGESFWLRGGREALEAFAILSKQYVDLELIFRTAIPDEVRSRYGGILRSERVKVLDSVLQRQQFEQVMMSADILLFPGYITPAMTLLEAMSYELPVVATDIEGIPEMVTEGKTGLLINRPDNTPYKSMRAGRPSANLSELARRTQVDGVVKQLVEKTSSLIDNKALRVSMGRKGREETEKGEFSLKRRNERLKKIFDEATRDQK